MTVNGLKALFEDGEIDETSLCLRPRNESNTSTAIVPQLRWQLLAETGDAKDGQEDEIEFWNPEVDEDNSIDGKEKTKSGSMSAPLSPSMGASTFEVAGKVNEFCPQNNWA